MADDDNMPSQDGPDDDDVRQTYNFAPGYYGLVYRAAGPDPGPGPRQGGGTQDAGERDADQDERNAPSDADRQSGAENGHAGDQDEDAEDTAHDEVSNERREHAQKPGYKFQSMKWGLIPFWTKRNPDYGSLMRTINCRDDSLSMQGGMWQTMKQRKRCIVVCQGFYEWLKKNDGKEKLPHFIKRKDGKLMCMAGLYDYVKFEDSNETMYTYSIITTENNKQMEWLHDRMPVILENGSKEMFTWIDPKRSSWSNELQSLLEPYKGELEIYPVTKDVGKVGNNSPTFIIPLNSSENKQNIANFFANQKKAATSFEAKRIASEEEQDAKEKGSHIEQDQAEHRATADVDDAENNAPKPVAGSKRTYQEVEPAESPSKPHSSQKGNTTKSSSMPPSKKTRSAVSNGSQKGSPVKSNDGSRKITSFFGK